MLAGLALVLLVFSGSEGRIVGKCELKAQLQAALGANHGANCGVSGSSVDRNAPANATPAPGKASPEPGKATPAPGKASVEPAKATPAQVSSAPGNATPAPGKASAEPGKATPAPGKATSAHEQVSSAPGNATPAPGKASVEPRKATPSPEKVSSASGKTIPAPEKVSSASGIAYPAPEQVSSAPEKVSSPLGKATPEPGKVSPTPEKVLPPHENVVMPKVSTADLDLIIRIVCSVERVSKFNTALVTTIQGAVKTTTAPPAKPTQRLGDKPGKPDKLGREKRSPGRPASLFGETSESLEERPSLTTTLFGIFQLSDQFACDSGFGHSQNLCSIKCSALTDDDIRDDIACLKTLLDTTNLKPFLSVDECHDFTPAQYFKDCV